METGEEGITMKPEQSKQMPGMENMVSPVSRRRGGFTLVEVLLAFIILMIGIIAVMALFPVGMKLSMDMVQTSTAALIAKNVRGCMEATDLADALAGSVGDTAGYTGYPKYFPDDISATSFLTAITDTNVTPHIVASSFLGNALVGGAVVTGTHNLVTDTSNSLYSWDARFDVGQGAIRIPWGWQASDAQNWFAKYWRYYVVDISVYRNYLEVPLGDGSITILNGPTASDANLIPTCELRLNVVPPMALAVGWYVRFVDARSDWYQIKKIDNSGRVLTLDRVYSGAATHIIATGTLIGHYKTFLAAHND